jgi:hypothetical protein
MKQPITFRTLLISNGLTILLVALIVLVSSTSAHSLLQTRTSSSNDTTTISYQGNLTDAQGQPINATLPMTFKLYSTPTGGTALWTEQRTGNNAVPVTDGLFSVSLGSVTSLPRSLFGEPLWLGISVDGDAEMAPRERLDGGAATATMPRLLGEDSCNKECGHSTETVSKGWNPVKGADADDIIEVTATTSGRPLVIHTTARSYTSPATERVCGISVLQDGSEVRFFEQDAHITDINKYGCSGTYVIPDLEPGTYTFRLMSYMRHGEDAIEVTWQYDRQIAVFEF